MVNIEYETIGLTPVQGGRLNYLLEERGLWNLTQIVNWCEIEPTIFSSVKIEAKKVEPPNRQEHLKWKATEFSMNYTLSRLFILKIYL